MPRSSAAERTIAAARRGGGEPSARRGPRDWRRPIQIGLVALLLLDLLFFVLAFRPAGQSFAEQARELDRLRSDMEARRQAVNHLRKVEANLDEARRQGNQFYEARFLPQATGFSTIMEELNKLAVVSGVHEGAVNYSLGDVKDRDDLKAVEITTAVEGDYPKIVSFINKVERSPLFLIVDSLSAAGASARGGVRLSVRLVTYFRVS